MGNMTGSVPYISCFRFRSILLGALKLGEERESYSLTANQL